ncbi:MAG TPA: response regulator, partial [Wenzhouxiangella sp.]|nr:response regulator [Wenzhouxiangella sp.]
MTQRLIAIVEDEDALRDNYREALERYGFATRAYASRSEAESGLAGPLPDLVIIDIGLGDEPEGGFELCRALRQRSSSLPIIFLTARDSDLDAVSGLRLGADDYLTKDISNQHLL